MTFLIYDDARNLYFVHLVLGIFWECGPRERAKEFSTRKQAAKMLQDCGKHRDGWRIVSERRAA